MPRKRKSKNQASEKQHDALDQAQDHGVSQATTADTVQKVETSSKTAATAVPKVTPAKTAAATPRVATPSKSAAEAIPKVATPSKTAVAAPRAEMASKSAAAAAPRMVTPSKSSSSAAAAVPNVTTPSKTGATTPRVETPSKSVAAAVPKVVTPSKTAAAPAVPREATPSKTAAAAPRVVTPLKTTAAAAPRVATPSKTAATAVPRVETPLKTAAAAAPRVATPSKTAAAAEPRVATPSKIAAAAPPAVPRLATPLKTAAAAVPILPTPPKTAAAAIPRVVTPSKTAAAITSSNTKTPSKTAVGAGSRVTTPLKTAVVGKGAGVKAEAEAERKGNKDEPVPPLSRQHTYATQRKGGTESNLVFRKLQRTPPIAIASISHRRPESHSYSQRRNKARFEFPIYRSPDDLESRVSVLEQFLMYKFKMKQLILKRDMINIISPEYEEHFLDILRRASERIEMVFAVNVKEVDPVIHAYDLVSKLKLPNNGRLRAGRGLPKTGLLMNVLGMIFMKGNSAKEDDIWKFLGMMKVYPGRKHSIFGEPRKLITKDLVRLEYLEYRQIAGSDPPSYEFLWGPKAHAETSKMQVLEFLARIYDTTPSTFMTQYEEALKDEEDKTGPKVLPKKITRVPTPPDYAKKYLSLSTEMNLTSKRQKKLKPCRDYIPANVRKNPHLK